MNESVKQEQDNPQNPISKTRKLQFKLILLIIPVLIFLSIELVLSVFNVGKDLSLFIISENYPGYYEINKDVNLRYFSKVSETSPTKDIFLIEKPDTCFRIFVFGGSTTRGFPYQPGTAFPRILYYRLQDAFPHKRIEVVNLAAAAINSYTYIDFIDEVLAQKPDLILLYGGHNEYYGAMGVGSVEGGGNYRWIKKLHLKFTRLRTYQLMQALIGKLSRKLNSKNNNEGTLMARIVSKKSILYNSKIYHRGIDEFRSNIEELVRTVKREDVPIIISDLVSNINDLTPLQSAQTEEFPVAIDVYKQAQELEVEGKIEKARELYYLAKDLDVIRFRASEDINTVLADISQKEHIPIVPMIEAFENTSPDGIIGNELILDHLHPNIDGYFLMADAFFQIIKKNKFISETWKTDDLRDSYYYRTHWGFTELDSLIGDLNIKSIKSGWPFKETNDQYEFLSTYKPLNYVDSLAYFYLIGVEEHIEDEHIKLAQYYKKQGRYDKGFEEYRSMINLYPYISDLYYDAIEYLLAQKKYQEALDLILSAPNMKEDYFYYHTLGKIKLKAQNTEEALRNLEYALSVKTEKDDPMVVLMPLYSSYRSMGDTINKKRIVAEIIKYNPNFKEPKAIQLKPNEQIIRIPISTIYDRAIEMIKKGEKEKALKLLLKTDRSSNNASIKKLIGMIYFMEKNYAQAYRFSAASFQLNPNDYDNLNNYFLLNLMKNDMKRAADLLQQLPSLNIDEDKIARFERLYQKRMVEIQQSTKN